ncbi:MAG: lysylphosphatidylglycerol synthase transmembrane domain-containing protein [Planctomycetota bacterium]
MKRARAIRSALKIAACVLVVGLLYLVFRRIGFHNILDAMRRVRWRTIGVVSGLYLAVFVLWSFRWQQLMPSGRRKSALALFPIMMAGIFGNVVTPGARVGGEPLRAYYMGKAFGGEKSAYFGTVLADKFAYGAVFFGFVVASVGFVLFNVPLPLASKIFLGGVVGLMLAAVLSGFLLREQIGARSGLLGRLLPGVYEFPLLKFLRRRFPTYQHFEDYIIDKLDNMWSPIQRAAGRPGVIARVFTIGAASWLIMCLAHHVLFRALGADVGFLRVLVIVTISTFFGDVSVSPGGAGFMEAAMLALCAAFGVGAETAAAVTLISRGIFYAFGLGLGGLCLAGLSVVYGREGNAEEPPSPS